MTRGEGGVKHLKKWVTLFIDGRPYELKCVDHDDKSCANIHSIVVVKQV